MNNPLKLLLAALLLLCLLHMPYGYYQVVRFVAMAGFALLAWKAHEEKQTGWATVYVLLALLFQPFVKVALGRMLWNMVDVAVAVMLVGTMLAGANKKSRQNE